MIRTMARKNKTTLDPDAMPSSWRPRPERGRHREHRPGSQAKCPDSRTRGDLPRGSLECARRLIPSAQGSRKRSRSWPPCWSARRCRSCRRNGELDSPSRMAGPNCKSGWRDPTSDRRMNGRNIRVTSSEAATMSKKTNTPGRLGPPGSRNRPTPAHRPVCRTARDLSRSDGRGVIDDHELKSQESRVAELMKSSSPNSTTTSTSSHPLAL